MTDPRAAGCMAPNTPPPKSEWVPPSDPTAPGKAEPTQVVRVTPIPGTSKQINQLEESFLAQIDQRLVWPAYMLVNTQWVLPLPSNLNTSPFRQPFNYPTMGRAPQFVPSSAEAPGCATYTPTRKCIGLVVPPILANSTIETYGQPGSSCVGCHETAKDTAGRDADFSFVLREAKAAHPKTR